MSAYFLSMYANRYKIPTAELDEKFTKTLQAKTGISENELSAMFILLKNWIQGPAISDAQLISFHNQLGSLL